MKILMSADWHINLRKKKVPKDWQVNRFKLFFEKISELEKESDIHIIAGDIFDKAPNLEETCLFNGFLNQVGIPTYIIPGNHEATKKGETFLDNYLSHEAVNNMHVRIITKNKDFNICGQNFQFFPYGEMQIDNLPKHMPNTILITHIRGEVPPHITAEYDFEKLRPWDLTFLGDLHFRHQYKDFNIYYPGSPMNINFDRDDKHKYGLYLVDLKSVYNYDIEFIDLKLPKLIRKTIKAGENMVKTDYDHTVFEVTGSIDELQTIENSELLDKKIAYKPEEASKLNLTETADIVEELQLYLEFNKIENIQQIKDEFVSMNVA